ncbi:MAG: site-specific DNA-methyltransferase, partial [Clostridia bacterium]|nr:site-specific DNA-methyltransferase [Clostridia bacterium]
IDMILCDLPYGTTACKWDTIIPFEPLWEQYKRIIKDNGAIVLFGSQPFTSALVMSNIKMFKYEWIWDKGVSGSFANARYLPLKTHENICVFSIKKHNYFPQMTLRDKVARIGGVRSGSMQGGRAIIYNESKLSDKKTYTHAFPKSVQYISPRADKNRGLHPTQKPVALMEYLIKTYTNEGEIVLDNCAGSGTTGVACINTSRNYILIEKEEEYVNIINKRLEGLKDDRIS